MTISHIYIICLIIGVLGFMTPDSNLLKSQPCQIGKL